MFAGQAYKDGFEIFDSKNLILVRKNKDGIFSKKINGKEINDKKKKISILFWGIAAVYLGIFLYIFCFFQNIWLAFQIYLIFSLGIAFSLLTYLGVKIKKARRETAEMKKDKSFPILKQWHACEHKLIYLLETGKKVTLETLKDAPIFSYTCGAGVLGQKDWVAPPTEEQLKVTLKVAKEYFKILSKIKK